MRFAVPPRGLLVSALDRLPHLVTVGRAVPDATGEPADIRVLWVNRAAREAHPSTLTPLVGNLWTRLYPDCIENGTLQQALDVLASGVPASGELTWDDPEVFRSGRYSFNAERIAPGTLLWSSHDISRLHQVTEDLSNREMSLSRAVIRLRGLQEMTAALGSALSVRDVLRVVAEVTFDVVGAARGEIALLDPELGMLRAQRLPARGRRPAPAHDMRLDDDDPLALSVRERRPLFLRDRAEIATHWPDRAVEAPDQSLALLPLTARRRIGGMALGWSQRKRFSDADQLFLTTVASLCAQALERARLYEAQVGVARELQRALLPPELPRVPGVECAARYLTAAGEAVGGDWYDVIPLPNGAIGLVMGDVEGHSMAAAAIMGQARNAVRAYTAELSHPAEVLTRTNRFLARHANALVTCCYLELHPDERVLTAATAGHPGPLVIGMDGRVDALELDPGPPLGVEADIRYTEQSILLPPGGTLAMFTDGLIDDRRRSGASRMSEVLDTAARLAGRPADQVADGLAALTLEDGPARDDAALLIVRLVGPAQARLDQPVASRIFGPVPASTPAARRFVHDLLLAWELPGLVDSSELLVSELVTNAIVHTAGEVRLSLRRMNGDRIRIDVEDDSEQIPQPRVAAEDDTAGRGLAIVDLVADRWGVEPGSLGIGKTVWLELAVQAFDTVGAFAG